MKRILIFLALLSCFSLSAQRNKSSKKTIILSLDGGGIKGIIPAVFLREIEKATGKQSYELFDVMGGTSTGGIISTALICKDSRTGKPYSADSIVGMYQYQGKDLFIAQHHDKKLFHAKYYAAHKDKGIEPFLMNAFGKDYKLSDSKKYISGLPNARLKQVFTTSYIVNSTGGVVKNPVRGKDYGPYLFNWENATTNAQEDYYVWEAARGTSSAPVFFPIAHVGGGEDGRSKTLEKWVVDGGTMSNNPSMWGISESFRIGAAKELEDVIVISIGCGFNPGSAGVGINDEKWIVPKDGNWGEVYWVMDKLYDVEGNRNTGGTIVNIMLESVQMAPNNQLSAFHDALQMKYFRLEPTLTPSQSAMDDTSPENIESLIKTAEAYLKSAEGQKQMKAILDILKR